MESKCRICLYGNSLILGTLGTSLRSSSQFEVTTLIPPLPKGRALEALKPDVILFDLESGYPKAFFPLLKSLPKILIIGISSDKNIVKMWAGLQLHELSTQGLLQTIDQHINHSNPMD
jgi:hypothetical protein